MSYETYYPEQRQMLNSAIVRRARMLPDDVYEPQVDVVTGARVGIKDVIARGYLPAPHTLIDVAAALGLRRRDAGQVMGLVPVKQGDYVGKGELLAQKGRRRALSPIVGRVVLVEDGMIVLQEASGSLELEAGVNGQVVDVRQGQGAVIETIGALLQGVWGNGKRAVAVIRHEPAGGMESIYSDELEYEFRGAIMVTTQTLTDASFRVMREQEFSGLIAPSIEAALVPNALNARGAVLLTEGFGSMRMSPIVQQFLEPMEGRQGTIDAGARPEVIINVPLVNERPTPPLTNLSLQMGMLVRVARADSPSMFGTVLSLPRAGVSLDNGLRTACAQVELVSGERIFVPLENLEIPGR